MNTDTLRQQLQAIIDEQPNSLNAEVAQEALDYGDAPQVFFSDLQQHGCQSGMVSSLIYYTDTHAFFERHYSEIEALREAYEENTGEPLPIKDDLKNGLAWFAFEQAAYRVISEL